MSVGLLVVRLKYGLYVGHLSKWFVFVNSFMFLVVCLWLHCRLLGLLITDINLRIYLQFGKVYEGFSAIQV
jgi:hypothetical protein